MTATQISSVLIANNDQLGILIQLMSESVLIKNQQYV